MKLTKLGLLVFIIFLSIWTKISIAHDTTHIHPLITAKIAELISNTDVSTGTYKDIYELLPDEAKNPDVSASAAQRLYWGTDFDAGMSPEQLTQEWLLGEEGLSAFHAPLNVMNGVVQEDVPSGKAGNHFYQAISGSGLLTDKFVSGGPSDVRAMVFFNQSIGYFGMYDESAKQVAFFVFGQALHHVEDMLTPAHIHNDTENVLFAPIQRYGQLINTHVVASTLRFLNCPCLVLKQTGSFSGVVV